MGPIRSGIRLRRFLGPISAIRPSSGWSADRKSSIRTISMAGRSVGPASLVPASSTPTLSKNGPVKFPPISDTSDRLDVQSIGPSEIYDEVIEGGSGGLQALAGEFVFHCHIPQHYVTGMWGFWRVYNTLAGNRGSRPMS